MRSQGMEVEGLLGRQRIWQNMGSDSVRNAEGKKGSSRALAREAVICSHLSPAWYTLQSIGDKEGELHGKGYVQGGLTQPVASHCRHTDMMSGDRRLKLGEWYVEPFWTGRIVKHIVSGVSRWL